MAKTATRKANGHTRQRRAPAKAKAKAASSTRRRRGAPNGAKDRTESAAKQVASKTATAVKRATPSPPKPKKLIRKAAARTFRKLANNALSNAAELVKRGTATATEAFDSHKDRRLPIQQAVDVAVPLRVAWKEWMVLDTLPEGSHAVVDVERDGDQLIGRTSGPRSAGWSAEILDEREEQSFAWQSHEGSDCAGLVTFHELSERLTRIELNLDVVPTTLAEAAQITTRLADRRAAHELRRLKARLELINPDQYEQDAPGESD